MVPSAYMSVIIESVDLRGLMGVRCQQRDRAATHRLAGHPLLNLTADDIQPLA